MKNVKILDCTLRDGGRIIDCAFPDEHIAGISGNLCDANIDIVELGFLRGNKEYHGNSTFFTELDQMKPFIPEKRKNTMYVAFSDYGKEYGMWDFSRIKPYDGTSIDGFRIGYRKENLMEALDTFKLVQDNGYKLFVQGVESLNYTDLEMLKTIEIINKIKPYAFGIVDTYGAMYKDDVLHLFNLLDKNLDEEIAIDFHSHNNMQLSFSFAQEVVEASRGVRPVIIDGTLEGLGKGAGNLNTELLVDYLNRKKHYNYDADIIFDTIDEYIEWIKKDHVLGYKTPYFMAGIYSSHPNNVIYLQNKHRMGTKDIKNILSRIEPGLRKRYDYDNIERIYKEYSGTQVEDKEAMSTLSTMLEKPPLLVMVPGKSVTDCADTIDSYMEKTGGNILSVNYVDARSNLVFFGNQRKYDRFRKECAGRMVIISSNVKGCEEDLVINYNNLIAQGLRYFDNSTIMLLNLLLRIGKQDMTIAGFDGFNTEGENYYSSAYNLSRYEDDYAQINRDLETFLKDFSKRLNKVQMVKFLTPSRFAKIFE